MHKHPKFLTEYHLSHHLGGHYVIKGRLWEKVGELVAATSKGGLGKIGQSIVEMKQTELIRDHPCLYTKPAKHDGSIWLANFAMR
jgi:hypothetical protein